MSEASERFKKKKQKYIQAVTDAIEPQESPKSNKIIPTLLIICILGTMLPFNAVMTFFSLSFVTTAVLSLILLWKNQISVTNTTKTLLAALTVTSVLSGCSPAFTFQSPPELIKFANQHNFEVYSIQKIGILGLGLTDATIEMAQAQSSIKELHGAQIDRGHGLISVVTVTIAGKS